MGSVHRYGHTPGPWREAAYDMGPEYASLGHFSTYPYRLDSPNIVIATLRVQLTMCMVMVWQVKH